MTTTSTTTITRILIASHVALFLTNQQMNRAVQVQLLPCLATTTTTTINTASHLGWCKPSLLLSLRSTNNKSHMLRCASSTMNTIHSQDTQDLNFQEFDAVELKHAKRVVLVRHGQSTWNHEGRIQGSSNFSVLTEKGEIEAETARQMLLDDTFDVCFHSPLTRSKRTAEIIWDSRKTNMIPDNDLREIDLYSFQVLSDNAANFVSAGDLLMVTFPHLVWTPCAAHCIDLMLEDIGKISWVNAVIKIAKKTTKFLYAHTVIRNHMKTVTGREILRPGTTRFATNFILLKSLYDCRDGLVQMFSSTSWRNERKFAKYRAFPQCVQARRNVIDDSFWERVEVVMKIVAPIVTVLRMVDGEGQPMGELYHSMQVCIDTIRSSLEEAKEMDKFDEVDRIFHARWKGMMYQDIHATAHALNPKYGFGNPFTTPETRDISRRLSSYMHRCFADVETIVEVQLELALYKTGRVPSGSPAVAKGIHMMDAFNWWTVNAHEYPLLSSLATRILTQPCSSSGCERNWSVFEQIHTKRRNRLASKRLNDLVYVHYNLKLHYKDMMIPPSSFVSLEDMDTSTPAAHWMPRHSRVTTEAAVEPVAETSLALTAGASSSGGGLDLSDEEDADEFFDVSSDDESPTDHADDDDDDEEEEASVAPVPAAVATRTPVVTYVRNKLPVKRRRDDGTSSLL